mmetsp:Transcript_17351/g.56535  ORF Transcript_17351/g.56535 Transcript_17351/m.56535 type:complete len:374 (+) Transcript_17351:347-1468(+)
MDFTARFGISRVSGRGSFVAGDVRLPVANHCSMATRSKVCPSAAITGSFINSNVIWHTSLSGTSSRRSRRRLSSARCSLSSASRAAWWRAESSMTSLTASLDAAMREALMAAKTCRAVGGARPISVRSSTARWGSTLSSIKCSRNRGIRLTFPDPSRISTTLASFKSTSACFSSSAPEALASRLASSSASSSASCARASSARRTSSASSRRASASDSSYCRRSSACSRSASARSKLARHSSSGSTTRGDSSAKAPGEGSGGGGGGGASERLAAPLPRRDADTSTQSSKSSAAAVDGAAVDNSGAGAVVKVASESESESLEAPPTASRSATGGAVCDEVSSISGVARLSASFPALAFAFFFAFFFFFVFFCFVA